MQINHLNKLAKININFTNNNIIVNIYIEGHTLTFSSGSILSLKGKAKKRKIAAKKIGCIINKILQLHNVLFATFKFKGISYNNKILLKKSIKNQILYCDIQQYMSIPHNGCRKKKDRRL
jgi:small subunit ribosomal protein S11